MPATADRRYEHIRSNPIEARRIVESLVPTSRARDALFAFVAKTITTAHRLSPASWGTSLFPRRVCVNVGRGAVIQVFEGGALLIVTGGQLGELRRADRALLEFNHQYSFVPDAHEGYLETGSFHRLPAFASAHADLVERAARNRRTCFWSYAHSPSVVALLRDSGHEVADPVYPLTSPPNEPSEDLPDIEASEHSAFEGRRMLRMHLSIERRASLARRKKEKVLNQFGRLACEVCDFDFERTYGSIGRAFAEAHHLVPLESLRQGRVVTTAELAIVCANCHRMLHLGDPLFSLPELRQRLQATAHTDA
jgi:hypothetical protein